MSRVQGRNQFSLQLRLGLFERYLKYLLSSLAGCICRLLVGNEELESHSWCGHQPGYLVTFALPILAGKVGN
jgi:hypothetical protein